MTTLGLGAMMAGGNPADGRVENDHYPTPIEPTIAILGVEKFDGVMHEFCCGDGTMSKLIEKAGYKVVSSDLINRGYGHQRDFFSIKKKVGHNLFTNPPWNIAASMIEHGLEVLQPRKMALLLKSTFFHAKGRSALFEKHPPAIIYPLTWRVDFNGKGKPVIECSWFVWHRGSTADPVVRLLHRPTPIDILAFSAILH
jgi:hypothetical protein